MQEYFYRITVHFTDAPTVTVIRRFNTHRRSEVEEACFNESKKRYGNKLLKIDAWHANENDPDVVAYKKNWG